MKSKCLHSILILFVINSQFLFAQNNANPPYTPKIIPPSPNAASIQKFGDIPVSPYTGTTDVSIPIYSIQANGISVPISLNYHTGGIRLSEEAGWVGLGWDLSAGGMISRSINDRDDFESGYFNSTVPVAMPEPKGKLVSYRHYTNQPDYGDWGYEFTCNYRVFTEVDQYNFLDAFKWAFGGVSYDFEPDLYSFNFLGRSGKFIIGRDGKVILQKQENLKIEFGTDGSFFIITDEQGTKYYFTDLEYCMAATGIGVTSVSSWMLSKIVTQQKDVIKFNYVDNNSWTYVKGIMHETLRSGVSDETPIYFNDAGMDYKNITLQSIDYDNCQIQFSFDGRDDYAGKKLNAIKIYSKDNAGILKYLKDYQFAYSYFFDGLADPTETKRLRLDNVKEISGNTSVPPYIFTYNSYSNIPSIIGKHSASVDHWGYFNGHANNHFTPPYVGYSVINGIGMYVDLPGANRDPSSANMPLFSLSRITYPTRGYTQFEYQPNYYDPDKSTAGSGGQEYNQTVLETVDTIVRATNNGSGYYSGTVDLSKIYFPSDLNPNLTVSVAFRAANPDDLNSYHNGPYGNIKFTFLNDNYDITSTSAHCSGSMTGNFCNSTVYAMTKDLAINSRTTYGWSAYISPDISPNDFIEIQATFTYKRKKTLESTTPGVSGLMAGGLRIKNITDYDANGAIAKQRTYDYEFHEDRDNDGIPENYSAGRMMGYIAYMRPETIVTGGSHTESSTTRYSSSYTSFTSQSSGNIVGYDQVTEYVNDPATNTNNGKTVYTFYNSSDTTFNYRGAKLPGTLNLPNNLNGLPKSKTFYAKTANDYDKISLTNYYYHSGNRIIYDAFKWQHYPYYGCLGCRTDPNMPVSCAQDDHGNDFTSGCNCPTNVDTAGYQLTAIFYPAISSEVILLDSTVETVLQQNDITKQIKSSTSNYYDNPKHYQVTRVRNTDSKGNIHATQIKYPQDYLVGNNTTIGNVIMDSMLAKNMVSSTVETRDSFYLKGSTSGQITGAKASLYKLISPDKIIAPDKQFKLDISSPVSNFQPLAFNGNTVTKDSRYRQMVSFDAYDAYNNIQQYSSVNGVNHSYLWGYNNKYPIAEAVNAAGNEIYATSFEEGGWDTKMSYSTVHVHSGNNAGYINNSTVKNPQEIYSSATQHLLLNSTVAKKFHYSGWIYTKGSTVQFWVYILPITGTAPPPDNLTNYAIQTPNTWVYMEKDVVIPAGTKEIWLRVDNNDLGEVWYDDMRLYPSDAQMTTYTYNPLIGMTSQSDANNRLTYFNYDALGRLSSVKNQDGNIIKTYCYTYAGQLTDCKTAFQNISMSKTFKKNDCTDTSYSGSEVEDIINPGTFTSDSSQAAADSLATNYLNSTGQSFANTNGQCLPLMSILLTNYDHVAGFTIQFTSVLDSSKVYIIDFPQNSDNTLSLQKIPQGRYNILVSKTDNAQSFVFTASGPGGEIQVNSDKASWVNVPVNGNTFNTVSIGVLQQ